MYRLKSFCVFVIISTIFIGFIGAECQSCSKQKKKEKNIYTKEANEKDFKHEADEVIEEEEEKSIEKEPVKKIDPEKANNMLKAIDQIKQQINKLYDKSFETLNDAIGEIDNNFENITMQIEEEVIKVAKEKDKDLGEVNKTVRKIINDVRKRFRRYRKVLAEKKELTKPISTEMKTDSDLDEKKVVKMLTEELTNLKKGGKTIEDTLEDLPNYLTIQINEGLKEIDQQLGDLEKSLNVDLTSVKSASEKHLKNISNSVASGLKQTSQVLSMALNSLLGLAATLQSSIK